MKVFGYAFCAVLIAASTIFTIVKIVQGESLTLELVAMSLSFSVVPILLVLPAIRWVIISALREAREEERSRNPEDD